MHTLSPLRGSNCLGSLSGGLRPCHYPLVSDPICRCIDELRLRRIAYADGTYDGGRLGGRGVRRSRVARSEAKSAAGGHGGAVGGRSAREIARVVRHMGRLEGGLSTAG